MAAPLTLFLIGKTGHGKSSTGNSLLGRDVFAVSDSAASVTSTVQTGQAARNGRDLLIVDCPGIGDTRMDTVEALEKTCEDLDRGIRACPSGIGAFLLVLNYGSRFTQEEKSTIETLKCLLGSNVVKEHCLVVFTHGEIFDLNQGNSDAASHLTFKDWISAQEGELRALVEEAGNRCFLVYNKAAEDKMNDSLTEVIAQAEILAKQNGSYTAEHFRNLETQRQQLLVKTDSPRLRSTFDSEVTSLSQVFSQINSDGQGFDSKLARLSSLANDIRALKQRISAAEKGTDILSVQRQGCDSLLSSVQTQEGAVRQAKATEKERLRIEALKAEQARREREEMDRRRKTYHIKIGKFKLRR